MTQARSIRGAEFANRALHVMTLAALLVLGVLPTLRAQSAAGNATAAMTGSGQVLGGQLNPFAVKEPMITDPNKAYPRVSTLPGSSFSPVSYSGNTIIAQLAHSSDGIVRLPPGDYSIPVRFY
jgi:hypothetical protein